MIVRPPAATCGQYDRQDVEAGRSASLSDVDHSHVMAALTTSERQQLLGKSDLAGLRHLAGHLAALALSTWLVLTTGPWRPALMLIQGMLLVFLFTLLHETAHRTPFRTRRLNDAVGRLCGFVVLIEFDWFRAFHLAHHRYTNDPDRDPELATARPATPWRYALYLSGIPDLVGRVKKLLSTSAFDTTDDFVPESSKRTVKRNARLQLLLYLVATAASVALGTWVLMITWLVPMAMAGPFLRAYLLAEHAGCPDHPSMFVNTRTVFTNPIVRFVAWNMPYHAEHHSFPAVPFHKLAAFHKHTRSHLEATASGYLRFSASYLQRLRGEDFVQPTREQP